MSNVNHVAIIMDGNGRWGIKKYKSRKFGHKQGIKTVEKFLSQNYEVTAHYNKNIKKLNILKRNYSSLKIFKLDLRDAKKVEKFLKRNSFIKNIDIFVSLSGYLSFANFEKFKIKDFYEHLNINYLSSILVLRLVMKNMIKKLA